ncbi:putative very-long-chain 3-oxoacyl-CoA reductase 1 [Iris pallida]|uniref:Very-long-chain 3-oxoacyl-CoA reductase 1 n=1 Tax=Iris pallida TaxID=29817 RepID=A0AAX6FYM2_IRIPA|nr:putative very-long-chain 3-oxoacyl-CoA reductase 1 [Iris pallida]
MSPSLPLPHAFFALLGLLAVTKFSASLLHCLYAYFLRRPKDLESCYGSWAVVTGCTDGIGKCIAFELARKGLNLVLVGRSPDKLGAVSTGIAEERGIGNILIKNVVVDLSGELSGGGMGSLKEEIGGLDVGVLVNCAGVAAPQPEFFHEKGMETWMEIVKVNLEAATEVTKVVLEGMLERRRGAVVNVGSGSGSKLGVPTYPLFDVYAGTKAYIDQFSKSLSVEYKNKGIDVQCQIPMYVDTKMVAETPAIRENSFAVAMPDAYARAAVRWIGYEAQCVPYFPHFLECSLTHLLPDFIMYPLMLRSNMRLRQKSTS